ncbi:Hypothetical predicted protein, partial [Olea europaea subsp. europaea]
MSKDRLRGQSDDKRNCPKLLESSLQFHFTKFMSIPAMLKNYKLCFGVWLEALRILDEQVLINNPSESYK